jgi:uncharacterized protein (TIGR02679 family)
VNDDLTRLRQCLDVPAAKRVLERLRERLEAGDKLEGTLTLTEATDGERRHFAGLFGERITRSTTLRLDLAKLAAVLRKAGLAEDLPEAVVHLLGPVENLRAARENLDAEWRTLHARLDDLAMHDPRLAVWASELRAHGLLKRLSDGSVVRAAEYIESFRRIWERLPVRAIPLAQLAVESAGDSHALDAGQPLANLIQRAIPALGEPPPADDLCDAERRRELWAAAGVLSDELSGPVLVLNLRAQPGNSTGHLLNAAAAAGEPFHLTLRQLMRTPPAFEDGQGRTIFVCENPTVLAAAANTLGAACAPLVCVSGQLRQSAHRLLRLLGSANWRLAYHGDFDWPGIRIANLVLVRHAKAAAWRMSASDYLEAPISDVALGSAVASASWDDSLSESMRQRAFAVLEEQMLEVLLQDLRT